MKLCEAIENFIRHCRFERGLSPLTLNAYKIDLEQFQQAHTGEIRVADIDKVVIRAYLQKLTEKYKPRSTKRKFATLNSFFTFLEQEEYIDLSPFRKLRFRHERAKTLPRTISLSAVTQLFECMYAQKKQFCGASREYMEIVRDIAVLELLFSTGVRVSEACRLRVRDVDLTHRHIIVMGKGKRERVIPLCDNATLQALQEYKECYTDFLEAESVFFLNRDKNALSDQSVRKIINKYQKLASIPESFTPHMFRHTLATLLLENGVDIRNIQTLLGHSSLAVTEIYTHVSLAAQRSALEQKHPRSGLIREERY